MPTRGAPALIDTDGGRMERRARLRAYVAAVYRKAYQDNVTGLAGMVAYNMLLSVFPLALLALFIGARVLRSPDFTSSVLSDLERLFPRATEATLRHALTTVRNSSTSLGVATLLASVWFGSSFWGALDTAFCRVYAADCRSWVQQKRFALAMLVVVLAFMAATIAVPTVQSILVAGASGLPLGLADVREVVFALTLAVGLVVLFGILALIYWSVPNRSVPWGAIWPGASLATVGIAAVDYAFPAYLSNISSIAHVGTTFVFVLIVLIWFYALALLILVGAVVNSMRLERRRETRPRRV